MTHNKQFDIDAKFYEIQTRAEHLRVISKSCTLTVCGVKTDKNTGEITSGLKCLFTNLSPFCLHKARRTAEQHGYTITSITANGLLNTPAGIVSKITLY